MKQMKMEKKKKNLPSTFQAFIPPHSPKFAFEPFVDEQLLTPSAITKFLYILKQPGSPFSPPHFLSLSMIQNCLFLPLTNQLHMLKLSVPVQASLGLNFNWIKSPVLMSEPIRIRVNLQPLLKKPRNLSCVLSFAYFEPASCGSCSCCPPYTLYLLPPCGSQAVTNMSKRHLILGATQGPSPRPLYFCTSFHHVDPKQSRICQSVTLS